MWWPLQMVWTYATGRIPGGQLYIQCQCGACGVTGVQEPGRMSAKEITAIRSVAIRRCNVCCPGEGLVNLAPFRGDKPKRVDRAS